MRFFQTTAELILYAAYWVKCLPILFVIFLNKSNFLSKNTEISPIFREWFLQGLKIGFYETLTSVNLRASSINAAKLDEGVAPKL